MTNDTLNYYINAFHNILLLFFCTSFLAAVKRRSSIFSLKFHVTVISSFRN